jgi:hypothetical protein
MYLRTLLKINQ